VLLGGSQSAICNCCSKLYKYGFVGKIMNIDYKNPYVNRGYKYFYPKAYHRVLRKVQKDKLNEYEEKCRHEVEVK